jgi:hypothetical protein
VLALALIVCCRAGPSQRKQELTAEDRAVINAAVPSSAGQPKGIVFFIETSPRSRFANELDGKTRKLEEVRDLLARNSKSISLLGFKPVWATYVGDRGHLSKLPNWGAFYKKYRGARFQAGVSLPGYGKDGRSAVIFWEKWSAWGDDPNHSTSGGGSEVLLLRKGPDGWKVTGTVGRAIRV